MKSFSGWEFRVSGALALAFALATPAPAANLRGKITHQSRPVADALVRLYPTGSGRGEVIATRTSDSGRYVIGRIRPGTYVLLVEKNGRRVFQGRIEVRTDEATRNVELGER
jgi:hypothetical protein